MQPSEIPLLGEFQENVSRFLQGDNSQPASLKLLYCKQKSEESLTAFINLTWAQQG